jgi:hypothetical protein
MNSEARLCPNFFSPFSTLRRIDMPFKMHWTPYDCIRSAAAASNPQYTYSSSNPIDTSVTRDYKHIAWEEEFPSNNFLPKQYD